MKYYDVTIIDTIASQLKGKDVSVNLEDINETVLKDLIDVVMTNQDLTMEIIYLYDTENSFEE